ncbi:MAG TPA: response regulator [Oligoflexus sp.]|uniref:response regulator n=1 Tax=Oligoflexus sp. TaxID=1971216 RepID=UPI002D7FC6ED|nr:response regulator [Oligoflexus sp.]HET9237187.1 response regulator [Oligoflexus sp.]
MAEADLETKAAAGDTEAQCSLAFLYEIGIEREQDYRKAAQYWQMAAKAGRQLAVDKLKLLLEEGKIEASWLEPEITESPGARIAHESRPGMELGPKILMADDEEELRTIVSEVLHQAGYRVIQALNGEEAVQKVLANPDVRLIITDLKMPKLNGLQFVKTLRRMRLAESSRIVVMTAYSQPALIAEGKKLAIDSWLVKPVQPETLLETVKRLLERKNHVA